MKRRLFWAVLMYFIIGHTIGAQVNVLEMLYANRDEKGLETFLMPGVVSCMDQLLPNDTIEEGMRICAAFIRYMRPEGLKEKFWLSGSSIEIRIKDTLIGFDEKFNLPPAILSEDGRVIQHPPPPPGWHFYENFGHSSQEYSFLKACFVAKKLDRHPLILSADLKQAMELFLGTMLEREPGKLQVPLRTREEVQSRMTFLAKYMDIKTEGLGLYYSFYSAPKVWGVVISKDLKSAQLGYYGYFDGGIAALEKRGTDWQVIAVQRTFVE